MVNNNSSSEKPDFLEIYRPRGKKPISIKTIKSIIKYANPMDIGVSDLPALEKQPFGDFGFYTFLGFYPPPEYP